MSGGQRDLATVPAAGGARVKLTSDAAIDWAPAWSPDGRFIYFASDRGGTMGIWRIRVDEASGEPKGTPEPVAAGVDEAMDLPQLSRDGTTLVFRSMSQAINPAAISFDASAARITSVSLLQHRTGILIPHDVSPDGEWVALYNRLEPQQDIFLMRRDGSMLTRLTNDMARDWGPRFTPDGKALTFFSNQGGTYQAWSMQVDGSGRTLLTSFRNQVFDPTFAPDGKRLLVSDVSGKEPARIATSPWPATEATSASLGRITVPDGMLVPIRWSPDGRWLSGAVLTPSGGFRGFGVFDLVAKRAVQLNEDSNAQYLAWLPDSRHVVYFTTRGKLVMQDVVSLARREITRVLPYPRLDLNASGIAAAPDGRTLYYAAGDVRANIWMVRRAPR